ncbi:hypothetical protein OROMI_007020 [Orobanche minor]
MEPKIYALNDITPDMKNWTARVCVLNKTGPRISSQATPIKFQKLLLADEQGNRVEAMLYRSDVDLLKNSLQSDETYLISNALVQPVKQGFENPLVNNKYQWIIGARTAVLPTEKKDFVFSVLTPVFTHYNQFHKFIGTRGLISTVAVIFSKHNQRCVSSKGRENTLREYVAIDEAFTPFVITFWNDAVPEDTYSMLDCVHNQHVIAALNFTVTKFHAGQKVLVEVGLVRECVNYLGQPENDASYNLGPAMIYFGYDLRGIRMQQVHLKARITYMSSGISHSARHLPHSFCFTLKISVLRNFKNALLGKDTLSDRPNTVLNISAQQTVPIHDILATTEPGRFTSTVKGQLLRTNQKFMYLCCDRCHCLTSAEYGCLFECRSCRLNKIATPRYRFSLSVFDATGELEVTMFGKEAEKLLNLSADDFWQKYQEDTSFVHTLINSKLEGTLLQIEIQSKTFLKQDGTTILSYTVQSLNCQKTTPLPTEQPSSCGITYSVPTENSNHNENLTTSTQAPPDSLHAAHSIPHNTDNPDTDITLLSNKSKFAQHTRPEHNKDASISSRGRTLKAKKLD